MKYIPGALLIAGLVLLSTMDVVQASQSRERISTIARNTFNADDVRAEVRFGRDLAARILANYPLWDNPQTNRYVNLVGSVLALFSGRSELTFTFGILDTNEVNAFATPGGYVFITRGALSRMQNEAQLAAVLGHEMAHITQRHMVNELKIKNDQGSAIGGLAVLIGGASAGVRTGLEASLSYGTQILFDRGYLLADEIEADRVGLLMAASAGYDPSALGHFLETVESFETAPRTDTKNHPVLADRLTHIAQAMNEYGLTGLSQSTQKERFYEMVSHP